MNSNLQGLIAAPHTPFNSDQSLALDIIPRQAAFLAHNGVTGAFICGTTGEGPSLTLDERRKIVETWKRSLAAQVKLVVHVGHLCMADSCALARHAQESGADAIAAIAPSFFKPASAEPLVEWCQQVALAAPKLPFYYYHMPAMTGVNLPVAEFLSQAHGRIPTLAGIKFTHEDLFDYGQAGAFANGRYCMLFGRDEILLAGLSLGATGAVGSTYNFAAPLYRSLMRAFSAGDLVTARAEQARARQFIAVLNRFGGLAAGKAVMNMLGIDCGPMRRPLTTLSPQQTALLHRELEQIGFFQYCSRSP